MSFNFIYPSGGRWPYNSLVTKRGRGTQVLVSALFKGQQWVGIFCWVHESWSCNEYLVLCLTAALSRTLFPLVKPQCLPYKLTSLNTFPLPFKFLVKETIYRRWEWDFPLPWCYLLLTVQCSLNHGFINHGVDLTHEWKK